VIPRWHLLVSQSIPTNGRQRLGATFTQDGLMYVVVPGVMHERPEIGRYVHNLGVERANEFVDFIEQQGLWELPTATLRGSGQPFAAIYQGEEGNSRSKLWPFDALPAEVITVLDVFNKLVLEAYASPNRVMTGEARWLAPDFSAREPLRIEFTLLNKGDETLVIQDPMDPKRLDVLLQLMVMRVPAPNKRDPSPTSANIPSTAVTRPERAQGAGSGRPGPFLELDPGQQARFTVSCSPYLSPGEHQAVLLLNTGGGANTPPNHVRGILAMELPHIHIVDR
jgi:hypothetical protein